MSLEDLPQCTMICSECGVDATKLDDISKRRWWWSKGYGCNVCKPGEPPPLKDDATRFKEALDSLGDNPTGSGVP